MTEHTRSALNFDFQKAVKVAGIGMLALSAATAIGNGWSSLQEFNHVEAQVRMLAETGKLTDPANHNTPKNHIVDHKGQKFSISISSALMEQNGSFRDASGQVVANNTSQAANGAIRSQNYSSAYSLQGTISRVEGSKSPFRIFFNNGGDSSFTETWTGYKPVQAPVSAQPFIPTSQGYSIPAPAPMPQPAR